MLPKLHTQSQKTNTRPLSLLQTRPNSHIAMSPLNTVNQFVDIEDLEGMDELCSTSWLDSRNEALSTPDEALCSTPTKGRSSHSFLSLTQHASSPPLALERKSTGVILKKIGAGPQLKATPDDSSYEDEDLQSKAVPASTSTPRAIKLPILSMSSPSSSPHSLFTSTNKIQQARTESRNSRSSLTTVPSMSTLSCDTPPTDLDSSSPAALIQSLSTHSLEMRSQTPYQRRKFNGGLVLESLEAIEASELPRIGRS